MIDKMFSCEICGKDFLIEDQYECEKCHKKVCPDCITGQGLGPDDPVSVCKNCMEDKHDNA